MISTAVIGRRIALPGSFALGRRFVALLVVLIGSSVAQAAPALTDVTAIPGGLPATAVDGPFAGNDAAAAGEPLLSQLNGGLFDGYTNWTFVGKSDDPGAGPFRSNPGTPTGTLLFDELIDGPFAISLMAANGYAVWFFNETFMGVEGVNYSTAGFTINGGQDLSHASLFVDPSFNNGEDNDGEGGPPPPALPEPASILLWSALGAGIVYGARFRRAKSGQATA